jgi:Raf kinase inhibitor-like YbhB/YbcL family protein
MAMTIESPDMGWYTTIAQEQVFDRLGCAGGNVSPALAWAGEPAATKSFAVTIYDPDAPTGSGFWHWVVFNIPASITSLPKGAGLPGSPLMPAGAIQGRTDYGLIGYGGPCPPPGPPHRYQVTVYALDVERLEANENETAASIGFQIHFHALDEARVTAVYGRPDPYPAK